MSVDLGSQQSLSPTHQHGTSASASSRSASPAPSLQLNEPTKHPLYGNGHDNPAEQHEQHECSMSDALSRSVTPIQEAQDQDELEVDAQLNDMTSPILLECNICRNKFSRIQERNRHIASYLPHSIICPFQGCTWTGRRQWDFKEHWRRKHLGAGQAPGEDANEIYEPKDFVKSIIDGTPVEEVARSAFARAQEGLRRLGKPDVGANVLGRNRDLRKWIRIHSSQHSSQC